MNMILKRRTVTKIIKDVFVPGKPFNPLTYDAGNLLALYNGDTLQTDPAGTWSDQSGNGFNLTLFNAPTRTPAAINGHDALLFDGINQRAENIGINYNQPNTYYLVFKNATWTFNNFVFDTQGARQWIRQFNVVNTIDINAGASIISNPNPALNNYDIFTIVCSGLNSEIRTNNNLAVIGNAGNNGAINICVGSVLGGGNFSNIEVAYLIIRNAADNTATQNLFINYLKNRFAL